MSLIRPELRARMYRWREVLVSLAVAAFGVWVFFLGGYFFGALGLLICGVAIGSGVIAARRLRFDVRGDTPGLIEVTEGQITYMSATGGGVATYCFALSCPPPAFLAPLSCASDHFDQISRSSGCL